MQKNLFDVIFTLISLILLKESARKSYWFILQNKSVLFLIPSPTATGISHLDYCQQPLTCIPASNLDHPAPFLYLNPVVSESIKMKVKTPYSSAQNSPVSPHFTQSKRSSS